MEITANIFDYKRWMAELISDNAEQRAFTAAAMNTLQCNLILIPSPLIRSQADSDLLDTFSAWIPLVWFQQVHQPNGSFYLPYLTDGLLY